MDVTLNQLSLIAQMVLMQVGQLFAQFLDNVEIAFYLFLARLFLGLDNMMP